MIRRLLTNSILMLSILWVQSADAQDEKKREPREPRANPARSNSEMPDRPVAMVRMAMQRMDTNQDGVVDEQEFLAPVRQRFQRADSNGDGKIDHQELLAARELMMGMPGGGPPGEMRNRRPQSGGEAGPGPMDDRVRHLMQQLQRDEDGRVAIEDLPEPIRQRLSRLDANEDGFIDRKEFRPGNRPANPDMKKGGERENSRELQRRRADREEGQRQSPKKPKRPLKED